MPEKSKIERKFKFALADNATVLTISEGNSKNRGYVITAKNEEKLIKDLVEIIDQDRAAWKERVLKEVKTKWLDSTGKHGVEAVRMQTRKNCLKDLERLLKSDE